MKKFTLFAVLVMIATSMFAIDKNFNITLTPNSERTTKSFNIDDLKIGHQAIKRASITPVIIEDQPDGELKTYKRGGNGVTTYYSTTQSKQSISFQSGSVDVVVNGSKIYIKDIVTNLNLGTWVEGTISADGKTVTIPAGQCIAFWEDEGYGIYVSYGDVDPMATTYNDLYTPKEDDIIFKVDGDVMTLQGTVSGLSGTSWDFTAATTGLCGFWTDDDGWQRAADYETELTKIETTPDVLVTPPASLSTTVYTVDGLDADEAPVNYDIKVGFDGNDVYMQGLFNELFPSAWIKGTLSGGVVTFPQTFVGNVASYKLYICGYGYEFGELNMNFDSATKVFTPGAGEDWIVFNVDSKYDFYYYDLVTDFTISPKTTGINGVKDITTDTKTRKVVENGKVIIEKNGMRFNAVGARVK